MEPEFLTAFKNRKHIEFTIQRKIDLLNVYHELPSNHTLEKCRINQSKVTAWYVGSRVFWKSDSGPLLFKTSDNTAHTAGELMKMGAKPFTWKSQYSDYCMCACINKYEISILSALKENDINNSNINFYTI